MGKMILFFLFFSVFYSDAFAMKGNLAIKGCKILLEPRAVNYDPKNLEIKKNSKGEVYYIKDRSTGEEIANCDPEAVNDKSLFSGILGKRLYTCTAAGNDRGGRRDCWPGKKCLDPVAAVASCLGHCGGPFSLGKGDKCN